MTVDVWGLTSTVSTVKCATINIITVVCLVSARMAKNTVGSHVWEWGSKITIWAICMQLQGWTTISLARIFSILGANEAGGFVLQNWYDYCLRLVSEEVDPSWTLCSITTNVYFYSKVYPPSQPKFTLHIIILVHHLILYTFTITDSWVHTPWRFHEGWSVPACPQRHGELRVTLYKLYTQIHLGMDNKCTFIVVLIWQYTNQK